MPVRLVKQGLREYEIKCNNCHHTITAKVKNKLYLRNLLRSHDWIWRDLGIMGTVDCVCPECSKGMSAHGNEKTAR